MHRLAWLVIVLPLVACGGGRSTATLSVTCADGTQLVGAESIDVPGDIAGGRPTMTFPDPANPGKTGTISVPAHGNCKITPTASRG